MPKTTDFARSLLLITSLASLLATGFSSAQATDPRASGARPPTSASGDAIKGLYRPPSRGAPQARIGSGSRGLETALPLPRLASLVPAQVAYSGSAQPTLYWYISDTYPADIEVSITHEGQIEPVFEANLGPANKTGIQSLSLADYGVTLTPGQEYRWYVTLVVDPSARSQDHGSGSSLIITDEVPQPSADNPLELGRQLAGAGLWYDAIDALSRGIAAHPSDHELHATRAALLDQVDLSFAAAQDR